MKSKKILFLLLVFPMLLSAAQIPFATVPKLTSDRVRIDGVISPREWDGALEINFSQPISLHGVEDFKEGKRTRLHLFCDRKYLYGAAVCSDENIPELMKDADGWAKQQPWFQPRLELLFGSEQGDNTQVIMTFLGKVYKNFLQPFYCKVKHGKDSYCVEFAIPIKLLVRSKLSPDVVRAGIYRASVSSPLCANNYYAWNDVGPKGSLQNPEFWGALLLGDDSIDKTIRKYRAEISQLKEKNLITEEERTRLNARLDRLRQENGKKRFNDLNDFQNSAKRMQDFRNEINLAKNRFFRKNHFSGPVPLLTEQKEIPSVRQEWKPVPVCGKDYWFTMDVFATMMKRLEKHGLNEHPMFKGSMFHILWLNQKLDSFTEPDGATRKMLEKYPNPFFIGSARGCTQEQYLRYPTLVKQNQTFISELDSGILPDLLKLYPFDKRFAGFIASEAYGGGKFNALLKHYRIPQPRNRREAYEALKRTYFLESSDTKYDPPFRNIATLRKDFRKYAGSGTGTFIHHMIYSFGDINGGQEFGETMDNAATYMTFVRGASRQYRKPWNNYSVFYGHQFINGSAWLQNASSHRGTNDTAENFMLTPDTRYTTGHGTLGLDCGPDTYLQKFWLSYPWLCGTSIQWFEGGNLLFFCNYDPKTIAKEDRLAVCLRDVKIYYSPIFDFYHDFMERLVRKQDRGVTYTPVGLIFDRWHGYAPLYTGGDNLLGNIPANEADRMMFAVDHTLFPRCKGTMVYSKGPFGDIFDVVTNDASDKTLAAYKVLFPVGDVNFEQGFAARLMRYVKNGGTLILNSGNLSKNPFPADFLGCRLIGKKARTDAAFSKMTGDLISEDSSFEYPLIKPIQAQVLAISADTAQNPLILSNSYGKGKVILAAPAYLKPAGANRKMLNLFSYLMKRVNAEAMPLEINAPVHYQVNRNNRGWVVMLFNPDGIPPTHATFNQDDPPRINRNARHKAVIRIPDATGKVLSATEWWTGKQMPFATIKKDNRTFTEIAFDVMGGDTMIIEIITQ